MKTYTVTKTIYNPKSQDYDYMEWRRGIRASSIHDAVDKFASRCPSFMEAIEENPHYSHVSDAADRADLTRFRSNVGYVIQAD